MDQRGLWISMFPLLDIWVLLMAVSIQPHCLSVACCVGAGVASFLCLVDGTPFLTLFFDFTDPEIRSSGHLPKSSSKSVSPPCIKIFSALTTLIRRSSSSSLSFSTLVSASVSLPALSPQTFDSCISDPTDYFVMKCTFPLRFPWLEKLNPRPRLERRDHLPDHRHHLGPLILVHA